MNPLLRELLTDLKAAALIGHPDTLQSALDGVRELDDDDLPTSALVPLGRALTPLPAKTLKPLFVDDDPAIRALVSVALGERYMHGRDVALPDLHPSAKDPNPEVRAALARALIEFAPHHPDKITPLLDAWLQPPTPEGTAPRPLIPALILFPFSPAPPFPRLIPLDIIEDHDFRDTLITCLSTLAEKGYAAPVFDLLSQWIARPEPNVWVITHALSASWAQAHHEQAIRTLETLAEKAGMIRPILRALERHK